jgi:hypothetical protein
LQRDHGLAAALDLLRALVADLDGEVDLAALERGDARLVLEHLHDDRVDRRLSAPVVGVRHERVAGGAAVLLELERACAVHLVRPLARLRQVRRELVALGEDDGLVGHLAGEVREEAVGRIEVEDDALAVGALLDAADHALVGGLRLGVRAEQSLERRDDVVGGHRRTVVELDALADLESPALRAVRRLP